VKVSAAAGRFKAIPQKNLSVELYPAQNNDRVLPAVTVKLLWVVLIFKVDWIWVLAMCVGAPTVALPKV
jgi:hypothetical protein